MEIFLSQEREGRSWQEVRNQGVCVWCSAETVTVRPMPLAFITGAKANRPETHQILLGALLLSW